MNFQKLKALIESHPNIGTISNADLVTWCNDETETQLSNELVSTRGLMASIGPVLTATIMTKLQAAADGGNAMLTLVVDMMRPADGGIDLGNAYTRASLDALVTEGVLTQDEVDALKSVAERTVSRAKNAGLSVVHEGDVEKARAL